MPTPLLDERSQERVLLSYQKDYGQILLAYNKGNNQNNFSNNVYILDKAKSLYTEITSYTNNDKNYFSDENKSYAAEISQAIKNFIENGCGNNTNQRKEHHAC